MRGVCVCNSPVEAVNHGLEASGCVLEIYGYPFICGVDTPCIAEVVRVFAVFVASKRVIESVFFDDDFDCGVVGPFEAEETGEEVLTGLHCLSMAGFDESRPGTYLKHPVLGGCTNNNLAVRIVQLGILTMNVSCSARNRFLQ